MANPEDTKIVPADDDAALDQELAASLARINAGESLQPATITPEEPKPAMAPAPKEEVPATPQPKPVQQPEEKKQDEEFRIPVKGNNESDEAYEARVRLFDLVKRQKTATSEEAKQQISKEVKDAKNQLRTIGSREKLNQFTNQEPKPESIVPKDKPLEDVDAIEADKARLRELGGVTKEDIAALLSERDREINVQNTLGSFFERHKELSDPLVRDAFLDFVDDNYAWQNKSGKSFMTVLELARESIFKPSETVQERVLEGAKVQEKINSMQFPGGAIPAPAVSKDKQDSITELMSTGMSKEEALLLISE